MDLYEKKPLSIPCSHEAFYYLLLLIIVLSWGPSAILGASNKYLLDERMNKGNKELTTMREYY